MMDPMKQYNSYLSAASSIYGSSPSPSSAAQQPPTSTTTAGGLLNPSASPTATASTPTSDSAGGGGGTGGMKEASPVSAASSGFQQQYNTSLENSSRSSPYGINAAAEGGGAKTSYSADSLSRSYFDSMQRAAQAAYTSSASTASDNNGLSNGRAPSADSSNNDVAKDGAGSLGDQQLANNFSSHQQAAALQVRVRMNEE